MYRKSTARAMYPVDPAPSSELKPNPVNINAAGSLFSLPFNGTVTNVDKFTYSGTTASRYEQAVIDTVKFLGFMSLKNGDHNVSGHNTVTTKRILKEAVETRKAADVLLASGAVVLLGTWSNGIAVGPGAGFARVAQANVTPITATKKSRKAKVAAIVAPVVSVKADTINLPTAIDKYGIAYFPGKAEAEEAAYYESQTGNYCDWQPAVILGPAYVAPLGTPPGLSCDGFGNHYDWASLWHAHCDMIARTTNRPAQPATDAPTPIRAMPAYVATAGDTVSLTYSHENGTTTDRVVTIQRMTASGFRGYDHTYRKARNYHFDHITRLTLHTGEEDLAAG